MDAIETVTIIDCSNLKKIENVSNIQSLSLSRTYGTYFGSVGRFKEITDSQNIDKLTLSGIGAFTTFTNISNLREVNIASCSSLRDLSPLTHPQAKVEVLVLTELHIVDLDVQGRIPDVTLIKCNSIINVSGLASCRKVTINYCSSITNVSALAQVEELTLDYSPFYRHLWRTPIPAAMAKTFQGLESLGHVRDLKLAGINMGSLDLQCYKDIQKLHIHRCNNVNIPLETLNW
jgi:hypothetical protein